MNMQLRPGSELKTATAVKPAIADCDIHPQRKSPRDLYVYLEKRWQDHLDAYGTHFYQGMLTGPMYPKGQPNASRRDAVPPEGGVQGSSPSYHGGGGGGSQSSGAAAPASAPSGGNAGGGGGGHGPVASPK